MQKECARVISAERSFWLQWVAATTIGSRIGGAISGALVGGGETSFDAVASPLLGALALGVTEMVAFGMQGQ